jgi:hypothetical protein
VQIRPTEAAPGDSVMFQLVVPGERDARTVEVAVQIPEGVLPFSYEDTPGWRRTVTFADDGSTDVVRWRGREQHGRPAVRNRRAPARQRRARGGVAATTRHTSTTTGSTIGRRLSRS